MQEAPTPTFPPLRQHGAQARPVIPNPRASRTSASCWRAILLCSALLAGASSALAADQYLDLAARGTGTGENWQNARTTPTKIDWKTMGSGDTLWIRGGNYNAPLVLDGVGQKTGLNIRIAPDSKAKAVFTYGIFDNVYSFLVDGLLNDVQHLVFSGVAGRQSLALTGKFANVHLRGLEVHRSAFYTADADQIHGMTLNNSYYDGTEAKRAHHVRIERCYIHHVSGDGINIIMPSDPADVYDNLLIHENRIVRIGDDGIQLGSNRAATISSNYIDNDGQPPLHGGHPDGIQMNPGGGNLVIAGNVIRGFNQNIFIEFATTSVFIYNNTLIGIRTSGTDSGMVLDVPGPDRRSAAFPPFRGTFLVANNTFYNFVSFAGINSGNLTVGGGNRIVSNNLFVNCKHVCVGTDVPIDASNIYFDEAGVRYYTTAGAPATAGTKRGQGSARYLNPKLVNPAAQDFRLGAGSAAIDSGTSHATYFKLDQRGVTRPQGSAWDVGALETPVGSTTTPPPSLPTPPPSTDNTAPVISPIPDQKLLPSTSTPPLTFQIQDGQTPATALVLNATSSDRTFIPTGNIQFGGSGKDRTVTVTPKAATVGSANIMISVSDGKTVAFENFRVTVAVD